MKYRAEIDGLRSIAVIPVILFHAGFEFVSGGFVGVDIFFVISGYLITSIILTEMEEGRFSLVNFYERRARRIFPALFLVMFFTLPLAWFLLLPNDMKDFSQSLVAVSTFSSNLLFWQETGYWGVDNELKPLLHTWSLAVEEQYYVLFPLFLMLMWRFPTKWILTSFLFFAISSLFAAQWAAYNDPTAGFFLLPTRAWELAIGACLAFYFVYRKNTIRHLLSSRWVDETLSILGLILISYSILFFDQSTPFPSFYALLPTIGTALIILFSSTDTLVGKLLGSRIPVAIGLISYSAYLWHQPLFAFARHRSLTEPDNWLIIILLVSTFIFAYISWRYIEKPFRTKGLFTRKQIFLFSFIGTFTFISIGIAGHITHGFTGWFSRDTINQKDIEDSLKRNYGLSETCEKTFTLSPDCRTSDNPEILVWGDSYAMHLVKGIQASSKNNPKLIQMTKSVCGPMIDISLFSADYPISWAKGCLAFNDKVEEWLQSNDSVKYVVLASPFSNYMDDRNQILGENGDVHEPSLEITYNALIRTLKKLEKLGVTPIIFSSPPANGIDLGRCLVKAEWMGLKLDNCDFDKNQVSIYNKQEDELLNMIAKDYRVIRLDQKMCENNRCISHLEHTKLFRDKGHLSYEGSAAIGKSMGFYRLITQEVDTELK